MKLGLKRNDCVSVVLPNIVEFSTIMLGILEAGNLIVSGLTVSLYLP
jgi:acyl-coenzyme A synthetase/AMP-(fatty) acid ligase